ncbi:MAG: hypothetical protein VW362_00295, partial [Candidatus Nanopelagicales bacterium]
MDEITATVKLECPDWAMVIGMLTLVQVSVAVKPCFHTSLVPPEVVTWTTPDTGVAEDEERTQALTLNSSPTLLDWSTACWTPVLGV